MNKKENILIKERVKPNNITITHPEVAEQWDGEKNGDEKPEYYTKGSNAKIWWLCNMCRYEWQTKIGDRCLYHTGCPVCANRIVSHGKNDFATICQDLAKEWNYDKNKLGPEYYIAGSHTKVWWKCEHGHEWQARLSNRKNRHHGCPYCAGKKVLVGFNDLKKLEPELCKGWDYNKNKFGPENYTKSSHKLVWWKCEKNHSWQCAINNRTSKNKTGCPYCSGAKVLKGFNDLKKKLSKNCGRMASNIKWQ
jgi:hypothetical protein